jgi:N-acetylmuramoyl-L-alanine amidase
VQGSKLLKAYVMLSLARQVADRLRARGLRVRIVQQKGRVMGPPYVEQTFGVYVDYSNYRELAQARSLV